MIYLDPESAIPMYQQIYQQIKADIEQGSLATNAPLKSLRVMEKELSVSRNTVDRAYQQLAAEGYIRSVKGMGYFVEDILQYDATPAAKPKGAAAEPKRHSVLPAVRFDFDFEGNQADLFPWTKWRKCIRLALSQEADSSVIEYEDGRGNLRLREALAGFLHRHRGVKCSPDQIIVVPGTQNAMTIIASILSPATHRFAFEEPGYNAMRHFIESSGYSVTSIPVLETGLYSQLLELSNCNLLYATPSHQFPTGYVTSIATRNQLLHWAYKRGDAYIIENDYDSEFRHGCLPIPSLQSLDTREKVIYMGTLSKILSPSTRCAYLVLPWRLLKCYEKKFQFFNSYLPSYHQIALAELIESGALERHLRNLSNANETKYETLIRSINAHLSDHMEIVSKPAGVHTMVRIKNCSDQRPLLDFLQERSIRIYPIKDHCHEQTHAWENVFLMGYSALSEEEIAEGCKTLASALDDYFGNKTAAKRR